MLTKKLAHLKCVRSVYKYFPYVSHLEIFWINICFCFYFVVFDGKIKLFQFIFKLMTISHNVYQLFWSTDVHNLLA